MARCPLPVGTAGCPACTGQVFLHDVRCRSRWRDVPTARGSDLAGCPFCSNVRDVPHCSKLRPVRCVQVKVRARCPSCSDPRDVPIAQRQVSCAMYRRPSTRDVVAADVLCWMLRSRRFMKPLSRPYVSTSIPSTIALDLRESESVLL